MANKQMSPDEVVAELRSGMTIGIGGWGSRRKPMALVRAILRSEVTDLTVVTYGGPDVGLLLAAKKVKHLIYGFVSLDSIPLEPHFRAARQAGAVEVTEYDEGMLRWGLYAATCRLPFLPSRVGLGSDVLTVNPALRMVASPYGDEELVAMPAVHLDAALVHLNRADVHGNAQYLGRDPYFDDLFCTAAQRAYVSVERIVPTAELTRDAPVQSLLLQRWMVHGVVEAPGGAHFTSCEPDYGRDEAFQREYAEAAADPERWQHFYERYLEGDEATYQAAVNTRSVAA
ncbi:CoA transferase subunit A [Dactylosporangium sp. CA-233914]|uniref:CoA transferase subunit A n=1 Tax=Dactylosporangium sp. CA-233914 TaxID=3239934 RepID=UPI003D907A5A